MALIEYSLSLVGQLQNVLFLLASSIAFYVILWATKLAWNPLKNIPGPTIARYTSLWYFCKIFGGDFHHENIKLHEKHGAFNLLPKLTRL